MMPLRRIVPVVVALAATCAAFCAVAAQESAQVIALPSSLARDSALLDATRTLRAELDAIAAEPEDRARAPRIALRRVAFDLLFRGAGAGAAEQAMPVAGLRLFALRTAIDAELLKERADGAAAAQFRSAIDRFASTAAHGIAPDPSQSDAAALAAVLRPLEEAIAAAETRPPAIPSTAWPTIDAAAARKEPPDAVAATIAPATWSKSELESATARWTAGIAAAHAPSKRPFEAAARAWSTALRDPARQRATCAAMVALDGELRAFEPGAFERRLRRGDPGARESCAGRADDLLRELDRRRADWARGWIDGRGTADASRAMLRAVRTLEVLDALGATAAEASVERRLGAWGGFAPPDEGWRIHPKALNARAVLAVEALVARQDDAVDRELAQLDRDLPLVLVADGLARALDPWVAGRSGIGPRLVAVRDVPAPGAYLGDRRGELMLLSRLLIEEQRARTRHDAATAEELRGSAAAIASSLLPSVGHAGAGLASLRDLAAAIDARAAAQRPAKAR